MIDEEQVGDQLVQILGQAALAASYFVVRLTLRASKALSVYAADHIKEEVNTGRQSLSRLSRNNAAQLAQVSVGVDFDAAAAKDLADRFRKLHIDYAFKQADPAREQPCYIWFPGKQAVLANETIRTVLKEHGLDTSEMDKHVALAGSGDRLEKATGPLIDSDEVRRRIRERARQIKEEHEARKSQRSGSNDMGRTRFR